MAYHKSPERNQSISQLIIPIDERLNLSISYFNKSGDVNLDNSYQKVQEKRSFCRKLIATLALIFAITVGAASTPITSSLNLKSPMLKLAWRNTCILPYLTIVAVIELKCFNRGFQFFKFLRQNFIQMILLGIVSNCMSLGYIWSAEYTIIGHTCLFGGLGGAFIVIYCIIQGLFVHKYEMIGTVLSLVGCGIALFDGSAAKIDATKQNILLGDIIAAFSSIFLALYFSFQGKYAEIVPPFTLMLIIFVFASVCANTFGCLIMPNFTLSMDPYTGVFGFLHPQNVQFAFINLGFVAGFVCFFLLGFLVKEFSPLVMCTAYLVEPFFAQIFGCILGLDKIPGVLSGLGCCITILGMYYVSLGNTRRQEQGK
ncbi:UNKNOWN [Stylonychia lemnae]|uniref:Drug metabolite transporter superfamily n=1 Tax=Stylonychia lemnae TaxID=5949 RepID=A0A078ATH8_STYLE|nr:UNKNOWN [Stylonychia lemnae]|eukprot:CDW85534.1 UNKNOWN [Stylonychia lemnae]